MREFRVDQKVAFLAADTLFSRKIDFRHPAFFPMLFKLEQEMRDGGAQEIEKRFEVALGELDESRIDQFLYTLSDQIEQYNIEQRLKSLKTALDAVQPKPKRQGIFRRLFST